MPVYNGEKYIREALDSALDQRFQDFELIISDNVSTDRTPDICKAYAARDDRVKYYRNEINVGGARNFNRAFERSSGVYFKWLAHDDLMAPEFLTRCVEVLDQDPSIVVCSTLTGCIDEDGELQHVWRHEMQTDADQPHVRLYELMRSPHRQALYGLIRSEALRQTRLLQSFHDSDGNLLAELSLHGGLVEIPEVLFYDRVHPDKYTMAKKTKEERSAWFNPNGRGIIHYPRWRAAHEYLRAILRAPLSLKDRALCLLSFLRWLGNESRVLGGELKDNLRRVFVALSTREVDAAGKA